MTASPAPRSGQPSASSRRHLPVHADAGLGGVVRATVAAVGFGSLGIFAKLAYTNGGTVPSVLFGRALCMVPLLAVFVSSSRRAAVARGVRPLLVMAGLMALNGLTYFLAISRMSPATTTLLIYLYPAIVVVGAALMHRCRIARRSVAVTALTLGGVALAMGASGEFDGVGLGCALVNAAGYAGYLLVSERALGRTDAVSSYALCGGLSGVVILVGTLVVAGGRAFAVPTIAAAVAISGAGLVSTIAASTVQLTAVARLGSGATALVTCLEIVAVIVMSAMAFGTPMRPRLVLGAVLVCAGALLAPTALPRRSTPAPLGPPTV